MELEPEIGRFLTIGPGFFLELIRLKSLRLMDHELPILGILLLLMHISGRSVFDEYLECWMNNERASQGLE